MQSLRGVETKLITEPVARALKETVSAFSSLGVAHCDLLNYGNILFLVMYGSIYRAVITDLGSSCVRDDESEEECDAIVEEQSDGWPVRSKNGLRWIIQLVRHLCRPYCSRLVNSNGVWGGSRSDSGGG